MQQPQNRLVIVGAGPIGLHAALQGIADGFEVTVLERGDVGAAVRSWEHVRLFTPFAMNSTVAGRKIAGRTGRVPADDALLSGGEYVDQYLDRLATSSELADSVQVSSEVLAVGRQTLGKADAIGQSERSESPFRLLIRRAGDVEELIECDVLLDCTGFVTRHRYVGAGGIPCPGELRNLLPRDYCIAAHTPAPRKVMVIGSGYSAATSVCFLNESGNQVIWVTRGECKQPIMPIADDSLEGRRILTERSNELAADSDSAVHWMPGGQIQLIERSGGQYRVHVSFPDGQRELLACDQIVANPGFRPDSSPFDELQVHRCYATEGPIRLAAHLLGERGADCLAQTVPGIELLRNPEPHFFILGAASYGRDSKFLLHNGLEQVRNLFETLLCPLGSAS